MIKPLVFNYPLNDRNFDYNHQELTTIQLLAKIIHLLNEVIEETNSFTAQLNAKENSVDITNKRKLSAKGDFTGSIYGRSSFSTLGIIDSNNDKLLYLTNQFSDGYTGLVIDCGFFEDDAISKNYDGGVFRV